MEREIKILHLYSKTLDLYGDSSNISAIQHRIQELGYVCKVFNQELGESLYLKPYDLIYMGHGKAKNLEAVSQHFLTYKKHILTEIEEGKIFFITGNSRQLFGKTFQNIMREDLEGLGLFSYTSVETNEVIVSDNICTSSWDEGVSEIISYGFINRTSHLVGENEYPWFKITSGLSDTVETGGYEGTLYKNFFATWQMGPILVRNPLLLKAIIKRILNDFYRDFDTSLEEKALALTLAEFDNQK